MLHEQAPGPVVTLNHAVAVAEVRRPGGGARPWSSPLLADPGAAAQPPAATPYARTCWSGSGAATRPPTAYAAAARLATSIPEQRHLNDRAAAARQRQSQL